MIERFDNKLITIINGAPAELTQWCLDKFGNSTGRYNGWPLNNSNNGVYYRLEFKNIDDLFYFWLVWAK